MKRMILLAVLALSVRAETWKVSTIDFLGDVGRYASIARKFGRTHIAYCDLTNHDLKYATSIDDKTWTIQIVDSAGDVGDSASITVDPKGNPHISYNDATNHHLKYATKIGGQWSTFVVDFNSGGDSSSIAVDAAYVVHISYFSAANTALKYAKGKPGNWVLTFIDNNGSVGWGSSIALDHNGFVHISYNDNVNNTLKYATNASGVWVITVADGNGNVAATTSLALDSLGNPHIAYNALGIRYAHLTSNGWMIEPVDITITTEWPLSIRLNAADLPIISYNDNIEFALALARKTTSGGWTKTLVDTSAGSPIYSSLWEESGVIRIAYFRSTADLGYTINQ